MTPLSIYDRAQLSTRKGGKITINQAEWGALGDKENMKMRDKDSEMPPFRDQLGEET